MVTIIKVAYVAINAIISVDYIIISPGVTTFIITVFIAYTYRTRLELPRLGS